MHFVLENLKKMTEEKMAELVYVTCALMSCACAVLLFRGYRRSASHLLLWSAICFGILALNNSVLVVDMIVLPEVDIGGPFWRNLLSASAGSVLLFGLIWEVS
jgi:hypothetical protein